MYAARFDDPIAHTSALAGLIGGAIVGAVVGAALVATVATGGLAAPLLIGAALTGAALGAWVGEYLGSLSVFSSIVGKITTGSPNVHVNSKPQARIKFDIGECNFSNPCIPLVATGSSNVFINGFPAARVDDKLTCGGFIKEGSRNVRIGGGTVQYLPVESEVPGWVHAVVIGAGVTGALLLGGWAAIPGLVGAFAVGYVGGEALGWVGRKYGDWLSENIGGLPSDWEKTGTFTGQALGGWLGAKGGPKAWDIAQRLEVDPNALGANGGNIRLRPASAERTPNGISRELYEKLRKETPTDEIRKSVNRGVELPMDDPALPGLEVTKSLHADHIVSMKTITEMEGFSQLTYENQLKVLNNPQNFVGLSTSANTSKGAKSFEEWTAYKEGKPGEIKVDEQFRETMIARERELEPILRQQIKDLLKAQKPTH
jgi:uncharacterized Zn-binding protein involved in type VI secretion